MTALGVNQSATTPPHTVVHKPLNGPITDNLLSCISFCLEQSLIKQNRLLYLYLDKDCFQSFFNLNIEEGNNSTYQELLAYHFVLVAAIVTELRRRWHFDSLSMISASPAGAITRNSFNPYLNTNNNFRWSLRTLTKGPTLISTYYHAKSLIRVCSELCSSRTWWPVAPYFCYWETGISEDQSIRLPRIFLEQGLDVELAVNWQ